MSSVASIVYFDVEGEENTETTLTVAVTRAVELGIDAVAVASTRGQTGLTALRVAHEIGFPGTIIVVGEHWGYHTPGGQEMEESMIERLRAGGARVVFLTHAFSGVERSFRFRHGGIGPLETMAETLRRFSRGVKTAVEMSVMLADAGEVRVDRDLVAVGGSGGGADSALVVRPASSNRLFDLKVREFLAFPRARMQEVAERVIDLHVRGGLDDEALAVAAGCSLDTARRFVREYQAVREGLAAGASEEELCRTIRRGRNTVAMYVEYVRAAGGGVTA